MYRQLEKKLVRHQYLLHMSSQYVNFGPLTAETGWQIWGTSANFNGVRVFASLLRWCHSTVVHQTLHDVWPSAWLEYYTYVFGGSCPRNGILPGAKSTLCPSLAFLLFWQCYCTALEQWASAKLCAWYKEWNYGTFAHHFQQRAPPMFQGLGGHHVGHRPTF